MDDEPPLGATGRAELGRIVRRARASWPLWVTIAALVSGVVTFRRASKPPQYKVTALVRASEGAVGGRDELSEGALEARLKDLTFTRARLGELMKRHPREFPGAARDLDGAYEDIREQFKVEITGNDFIAGDSEDEPPPRSAQISVSFTTSTPNGAWVVTHELVDMLIDSELARQRAALLREQAAKEAAVERAEEHADDGATAGRAAIWARLQAADQRAANARLAARAAEQGQTLRFELVDPGRMPAVARKSPFLIDFVVILAVALLAACTLAGAFDPRVTGGSDLRALHVPLLGEMPALPAAPTSSPPAPA